MIDGEACTCPCEIEGSGQNWQGLERVDGDEKRIV